MAEKQRKGLDQAALAAFAASDFYQLLSVSLQWPSGELVRAILDGSYLADGLNILAELACREQDLQAVKAAFEPLREKAGDANILLTALRREYTRLFNHPEQPVIDIYESVFLSKQKGGVELKDVFLNPVTADVERCYRAAGLINKSREPADHLVAELEFMMYLYRNKGQALQEGNEEQAAQLEEHIKAFVDRHLGNWCPALFALLETHAQVPFYQGVGKVAKSGLSQML